MICINVRGCLGGCCFDSKIHCLYFSFLAWLIFEHSCHFTNFRCLVATHILIIFKYSTKLPPRLHATIRFHRYLTVCTQMYTATAHTHRTVHPVPSSMTTTKQHWIKIKFEMKQIEKSMQTLYRFPCWNLNIILFIMQPYKSSNISTTRLLDII